MEQYSRFGLNSLVGCSPNFLIADTKVQSEESKGVVTLIHGGVNVMVPQKILGHVESIYFVVESVSRTCPFKE